MNQSHSPKHAYLHIPFCTNKCFYCDFNIFVWQGDEWVEQYLDALEREMKHWMTQSPPEEQKTIYIGGGTPSLLNAGQLDRLLAMIHRYLPKNKNYEMTLEVNPGTLTSEKASLLYAGGVNRLSVGVQTFNDNLLKQIGRTHTGEDAIRCIEMARKAGFSNLSLDLIFGLPNQDMKDIIQSLDMFASLQIEHVSVYNLKVEEQTLFGLWQRENRLALPSEDVEVEMYTYIIDRLAEIGLHQYEISNFAKPGYESKHNLAYWRAREYYGFGAGAHGYINQTRYENIGPIRPYMKATEIGVPIKEQTIIHAQQQMEEMLFLGLRLNRGIQYAEFEARWGTSLKQIYNEEIQDLLEQKLLEEDSNGIHLTSYGRLLSNEVFARFLRD